MKGKQSTMCLAVLVGAILLAIAPLSLLASVSITGAPARVMWDVGSYALAGTNTGDIVGDMWVSNATAGGAASSFNRSGLSFFAPAIALQVGKNYITVNGTNAWGDVSSHTINIWRYSIDGSGQQSGSKYGRRWRGTLVGWGDDGQTNCPVESDYVAVAAGNSHSLALHSDGTVTGWGDNYYGQTNCPSGNDFVAVAAGEAHSLALRSDGTLVGWGFNYDGQTNCPSGNDFVAVAAGGAHSLALRSDGTVTGWGDNESGAINCPTGNNFVALAAVGGHSLALRSDGTVTGWGWNGYGQTNCPSGNDFVAVGAGSFHSLALRSDGTVTGWGDNYYGQTNCPNGNDFVAVAAGGGHSLALRSDGTVTGWGDNENGSINCPTENNFVALAAGEFYSLTIKGSLCVDITNADARVSYDTTLCTIGGTNSPLMDATGRVVGTMWWTNAQNGEHGSFAAAQNWIIANTALGVGANVISVFGTNKFGLIGNDSVTITRESALDLTSTPVAVSYSVTSYAVAGTNTSDILGDMWVSNATAGGAASSFNRSGLWFVAPAIVLQVGKNYITVYGTNAAAVVSSDTINMWRYNIDGSGQQSGSKYGRRLPGIIVGWGNNGQGQTACPSGNDFVAVAAGTFHSLALRSDGTVTGWGWNYCGQTNCPSGNDFVAVAAGEAHSLALRRDGTVTGWGWNSHGQTNCPSGNDFVAVAAGEAHSLALRSDGTVTGWGDNGDGQTNCPVESDFVAVAAAGARSLALRSNGRLFGWGAGISGVTDCPSGNDFVAVAAGNPHSLALRSDGTLSGWGLNHYGQTNCPSGNDFVAVAAGNSHSLALRSDGTVTGWGYNGYGQTNCPSGDNFVAVAAGWDYSLAIQYFTPCVDITNVDTRVNYDTTFCTIGGTNSPLMDATNRVVGTMWWSNSINSSNGTFAAAQYWMIENITLDIGTNIISVLGTNAFGLIGSDSVTIIRDLPEGASAVMAALALASMAVRKRQRHLITVSRR